MSFPSEKLLKKMRRKLARVEGSRGLAPDAGPVDRLKYAICKQFVIFRRETDLTQRAMARQLGIDEALMSKLLHYRFDEFTVDRLTKFLGVLYPDTEIELRLKKKPAA